MSAPFNPQGNDPSSADSSVRGPDYLPPQAATPPGPTPATPIATSYLPPAAAPSRGQGTRWRIVAVVLVVVAMVVAVTIWLTTGTSKPPAPEVTPSASLPQPSPAATSPYPDGTVLVAGRAGLAVVNGLHDVTMIAASDIGSNFAVQADGSLWAWGNDEYGQLGLGGSANPPEPQQVDLQDVVGVATGGDVATYALTSDGMVWGWGRGIPDMATGSTVDTPTPIRVMVPSPVSQLVGSEGGLCVLTEDGQVWAWGEGIGFPAPAQVPGLASVRQVAMSDSVGLALLDDGTVWGWGGGQWGDIGDGTRLDRSTPVEVSGLDGVTAIAKGESSSYALRSDGTVWCWGFNLFGQCGTGATPASESSPDADYPAPVQVAGLSGVRQIASGMQMGYAWTADGIWAWGNGWAMNMIDSTAVPAGFSGVPKPALLAGLPPIKSIADAESPLMIVGTP